MLNHVNKFLLSVKLFHDVLVDFSKRLLHLALKDGLILQKILNHLEEGAIGRS
jgi:hypothetical protein